MNTYSQQSIFLEITPAVRIAILLYLFLYRLAFPVVAALITDGSTELLFPRIIAESLYTLLLAFPFIFHRLEYGWLHPLVLPTLFEVVGKALIKNPLGLFFPLDFPLTDFTVETVSTAAVLSISTSALAQARLGEALIRCLAYSALLLAFFFGPRIKVPRLRIYRPGRLVPAALLTIGLLTVISVFFIVSQGGVSQLLVAMRGGRRELFAESGQFLFVAEIASTIALIWFMYEKRPFRNPVFIATFILTLLLGIIVSGSRSSLILPVIMVVLLWWKRKNRPLILPTILVGVIGMLVIGIFGSIRQDYGSTSLDVSVLNPARYAEMVELAYEETERRSTEESQLAVFQGANDKGLLWGRSYAGIFTFWIPRSVWNDKPKPADAYNMWINFSNHPVDSKIPNYGYYGIPVGPEMEAYWNFHIPGVIFIFLLMGLLYRYLEDVAKVYSGVPFFWVVYLLILMNFRGTSISTVDMTRNLLVILLFAYAANLFRWGGPSNNVGRTAGIAATGPVSHSG